MGRKTKNIKIELNNRINELLRIGVKKIKNDPTNSNRVDGIHSIKSADVYRRSINLLADFLKDRGIRKIDDITKEHIQKFFDGRKSNSAYTHSKDLSAINKTLDTRYTVRDFGLPNRSYKNITNNRGLSQYDTSHRESNKEQLAFVRACGIRRQSISTITPAQAISIISMPFSRLHSSCHQLRE